MFLSIYTFEILVKALLHNLPLLPLMLTSALPVNTIATRTPSVPTPIPVSSALVEPVSRVTVVSVKISMNAKLVKTFAQLILTAAIKLGHSIANANPDFSETE